jgi:hypothetical protein
MLLIALLAMKVTGHGVMGVMYGEGVDTDQVLLADINERIQL